MNERSITGLLPCPFCGGIQLSKLTFPATDTKPEWNMLQCESCGATGPFGETEQIVRAKWQLRAEQA